MEDLNEQMDAIQEMNDAMSQPLGQIVDDGELEDELAELEELEADELLMDVPNASSAKIKDNNKMDDLGDIDQSLPSVPQKDIEQKTVDEDNELNELEAMMG